jgi:long-chain-fatty-acid--CoA ligase ACSBG
VQTNFREYYNAVIRAAKSLIKLGVEPGHGVCILGFNAPEWHISNLAGIVSGAMACGIYATNNADACYHVMNDCKAQAIFCENKAQIKKILEIRDRLPNLKAIIQYLPEPLDPEQKDAGVLSYSDFLDIGQDVPDYEVQWRIEKQKPGSCCSLIYTSGTTGPPKGVMLSHDNITWTAKVCASLYNLTEVGVSACGRWVCPHVLVCTASLGWVCPHVGYCRWVTRGVLAYMCMCVCAYMHTAVFTAVKM